jgi:hypothetical protein
LQLDKQTNPCDYTSTARMSKRNGVTGDLSAQVSYTQQNQCAVALPPHCVYVFQLPMGKVLHVDAVYPPVAIARHTDDHEF